MLLATATSPPDPHHSPSRFLSHSPAAFSSTPHHHTTSPPTAYFITGFLGPPTSCFPSPSPKNRVFGSVAAPCAVVGCREIPPGYPAVLGSSTDSQTAHAPLFNRRRRLGRVRLPAQRPATLQRPPVRSPHWRPRPGRQGKAAKVMVAGVGAGRMTPLGTTEGLRECQRWISVSQLTSQRRLHPRVRYFRQCRRSRGRHLHREALPLPGGDR